MHMQSYDWDSSSWRFKSGLVMPLDGLAGSPIMLPGVIGDTGGGARGLCCEVVDVGGDEPFTVSRDRRLRSRMRVLMSGVVSTPSSGLSDDSECPESDRSRPYTSSGSSRYDWSPRPSSSESLGLLNDTDPDSPRRAENATVGDSRSSFGRHEVMRYTPKKQQRMPEAKIIRLISPTPSKSSKKIAPIMIAAIVNMTKNVGTTSVESKWPIA
jgi:hypothetical protein